MSVDFTGRWAAPLPAGVAGPADEIWSEPVNMNSRNGVDLLGLLGLHTVDAAAELEDPGHFSEAPYGELPAAVFLDRIITARMELASTGDDAGLPYTCDGGEGTGRARSATWRSPGLFAQRLDELEVITRAAAAHDGIVVWS
jgi:hypothetical protein